MMRTEAEIRERIAQLEAEQLSLRAQVLPDTPFAVDEYVAAERQVRVAIWMLKWALGEED
jgi:hypothetical protein